jgi:NAD(P)-dependent dehydrogenase (short-subunit alcohol dehydrogenase family)
MKISIVTGATSGFGKETARGLAQKGFTVVLPCRDLARGEATRKELIDATGNPSIIAMSLDLASIRSIDAFIAEFRRCFARLDLLVNNAGAWFRKRKLTESGLEATFAVNHLGPFALTMGLLDLLEKSAPSRIVMVSSMLHLRARLELDDLQYEKRRYASFAAYNASKLANVIFTRTLARRLGKSEVRVNAVHPGAAGTGLARDYGKLMMMMMRLFYGSPKGSATLFAATEAEGTGHYFKDGRVSPHSPLADDEQVQERLWSISEQLIGWARRGLPVASALPSQGLALAHP